MGKLYALNKQCAYNKIGVPKQQGMLNNKSLMYKGQLSDDNPGTMFTVQQRTQNQTNSIVTNYAKKHVQTAI